MKLFVARLAAVAVLVWLQAATAWAFAGVPSLGSTAARDNLFDVAAFDPSVPTILVGNYINGAIGANAFYGTLVQGDTPPAGTASDARGLDPTQWVGIYGQDTYVAHIDAGQPFAGPSGILSRTMDLRRRGRGGCAPSRN